MNRQIQEMLVLQEIDAEIMRLHKDLQQYPDLRGGCERRIAKERARLADLRNRQVELEKAIRALDLEMRQHREDLNKLMARQNQVKTQKEYDALSHEIAQIEASISKKDDDGLDMLSDQEMLFEQIEQMTGHLASAEAEHEEEMTRLVTRETEKTEHLKACEQRRVLAAARIDPAALARYERLSTQYPGQVVVQVRDGNCGGCHLQLLPKRLQQVARDDTLTECDSCHRFLYLGAQIA